MQKIAYDALVDAPAADMDALLAAHDVWEHGHDVDVPALKIGAIHLLPEVNDLLVTELESVPYGLIGDHNRQYTYSFTPKEQDEITNRNQGLDSSLPVINQLSRLFLNLVQLDAEELRRSHILGWDLQVRGGRYDGDAHNISNNLHIDGGPPILRYVGGLVGAATGFAASTINKAEVSEDGVLYDPVRDIDRIEGGDIFRFGAFTPHIAPPTDGKARLLVSATAWLI